MSLLSLTFLHPAILWALCLLPLLWWLLRMIPPAPRRIVFPALMLMEGLAPEAQTPARTPWWLLLLRLAILGAIILGLARPLVAPPAAAPETGPVAVIVDNGWASAHAWRNWRAWLDRFCLDTERAGQDIMVVPTAPGADGALHAVGPLAAFAACQALTGLEPQAWPADHEATLALLREKLQPEARVLWLSDGLNGKGTAALHDWLVARGAAPVIYQAEDPLLLLRPAATNMDLNAAVERAAANGPADIAVEAQGADGQILGRAEAHFAAGSKMASAVIDLPLETRNRAARLALAGQGGANAVWLLDGKARRMTVGLIGDAGAQRDQPLLSSLYYLDRALQPDNQVESGGVEELLSRRAAIIIAAGDRALLAGERAALADWVAQGGVLIQFAGPDLRQNDDVLLPVRLLDSARNLGGAMSWAKPQPLRAFPDSGPFAGLAVPQDVTVARQILADPAGLPADAVWAMLEDGTPLVTGAPRGRGLTVLFHIPANPDWSNLPLSGLFIPMLQRLIERGTTGSVAREDRPLPPAQSLDGFGRLQPPSPRQKALTPEDQAHFLPAPEHPPGYYGTNRRAFNLGAHVPLLESFAPAEAKALPQDGGAAEWRPWLLTLALLLFFADLGAMLWLRGLLPALAAGLLLCAAFPHMAEAADGVTLTGKTWLGIVRNGAGGRAALAQGGLLALAQRLQAKTALEEIGVTMVDLENDDLAFFPFLYWPLAEDPHLGAAAQRKLQDYFAAGGMLLIDLTGAAEDNPALMASGVELPMLAPVTADHPLYRSFYLLDDCPGRTRDGPFWSERDSAMRQDGVPAVFVGSRDWAAAWARGRQAGGREQELAFRCGVNLVIYALTGNYKTDQIHVPVILERLHR